MKSTCRPQKRSQNATARFRSAENRANLDEIDLNFHDLRHECASRLYFDERWTIYDVSLLLGHADVKTTERYIGVDQKKRLHELVEKRALTLVK